MNGQSTLEALRRRWWIIIILALAGGVAGAIPEPERVDEQVRTFTATHTLLLNDTSNQVGATVISPNQVTLFVTTGEVPARAADELGFEGNPASLASQVTPIFDFNNGALTITATATDAERAELVADTFADGLVSYLAERQDVIYQERLAAALERLAEIEIDLVEITRDLARDEDDPVLLAQQSAISRQYSVAFEQSETLSANPPVIGFTTLQRAQSVEITDRGIGAPRSRTSRGILGGIVGFALGAGLAVILGFLDRRIRSREQAEQALDLRARVIIPKVKSKDRDQLVVRPDRHDALSDAYRTVRNVVSFVHGPVEEQARAPVTLVVSPRAGDGKTSLAANLAAASAESGRRTVLVNSDFRRPRLSTIFGPRAESPLPFMLEDIHRLNGRTLLNQSGLERLRILDLSSVAAPAGELARATADKLDEMRSLSDHVVIDTSPIGATAEVLDLVPHADVILMMVRVGNTTVNQAQRSIAILRDLTNVPIVLVLGGMKSEKSDYYEYTDPRTVPPKSPARRPWWRRKPREPEPTDLAPEVAVADDPTDERERPFDFESVE